MAKNLFEILSTTQNDFLLKEVTNDLEDFQHDVLIERLSFGYDSKDPNLIRTMSLFNSAFTHRTLVFLLTNRSFVNIIQNDEHNKYKNCDGTAYKCMIKTAIQRGFIKGLRKGTTGKAGLYEIVHPDLIQTMKEIYLRDVTEAYEAAMDFEKVYAQKKQDAIDYWEGKEEESTFDKNKFRNNLEAKLNSLVGDDNE